MKFNTSYFSAFFLLLSALCFSFFCYAGAKPGQISLAQLGKFKTQYSAPELVEQIVGEPVIGIVTVKPKTAYQVTFPFAIQQLSFSVFNGQRVERGQVVGRIDGLDIHHFNKEVEVAKNIYLTTKKHLTDTQRYADSKTLKNDEWLAINKRYLESKLAYEHLTHVQSQLRIAEDGSVELVTPQTGLINLDDGDGRVVYEIQPEKSILIKVSVPIDRAQLLSGFNYRESACQLQMEEVEAKVRHYRQQIWLRPSGDCNIKLGQRITLSPIYALQGFRVLKRATFELDNKDYVVVKHGDTLQLAEVSIVAKEGQDYIVNAPTLTPEQAVLSSSVSIAQGIFSGLGE
ncbi:hypothetical protein [Pseudoalteromonas piscicida]|uniref:RND efflux pump membrane fusion protein barrel-sandwich domain-containing protein n=1 Tax=Pseudoalteromonas piscicida TaxID=43662 RepID=A0A2A5JUM4_PSEO7|nr:hypothetical protein [Pseudoalteromonas piscicida]PCK33173.1 hypothetical protein CEX98_03145 [Pseudoalteromonas piscicida]